MAKNQPESKALEQARTGLQAIIGELEGIKTRLCAIADDLTAAEPLAVVVKTADDGTTYTVERWISECLGNTARADLGSLVREQIDEMIASLTDQTDFDALRQEIRDFE